MTSTPYFELHSEQPFDLDTLVERYLETDHIGNLAFFKLSFLALVEALFGKAAAVDVQPRLL